jgi:membrane protease subunit (stomatin/prohibitin family)
MGLIRQENTFDTAQGEFIACPAPSADVLVEKGTKHTYGDDDLGANTYAELKSGYALLVTENGKIVDFSTQEGVYTFDPATAPKCLCGANKALNESFNQLGKPVCQVYAKHYVYYVNMCEITGNKFGIGQVVFRDSKFSFPVSLKGYGVYDYRITDPIIFFAHLPADLNGTCARGDMERPLKAEFQPALQTAIGNLAYAGFHYDTVAQNPQELMRQLDITLDGQWKIKRGIESLAVRFIALTPDEESLEKISQIETARTYFSAELFEQVQSGDPRENTDDDISPHACNAQKHTNVPIYSAAPKRPEPPALWVCACGERNSGNFCSNCGAKKPERCKHRNATASGVYCPDCGAKLK